MMMKKLNRTKEGGSKKDEQEEEKEEEKRTYEGGVGRQKRRGRSILGCSCQLLATKDSPFTSRCRLTRKKPTMNS
jgi:hypothetical protein